MLHNPTLATLKKQDRQQLPVLPEFANGKINYHDPKLFNQDLIAAYNDSYKHKINSGYLPTCSSPGIQNEILGFLSHNIADLHFSPTTIRNQITDLNNLAQYVDEMDPQPDTILDLSKEDVIRWVTEKIQRKGYKCEPTIYETKRVDSTGEVVYFNKDPHFISTLNTLWNYIIDAKYHIREYDKDIWDVRKLGIPVNIAAHNPAYQLNFTEIKIPWFKSLAKDFIFFMLPTMAVSTVIKYTIVFKHLSEFISLRYPSMKSFEEFDREKAEAYLSFLGTKGYSASWFDSCISMVRNFFLIELIRKKPVPKYDLFLETDYHKKPIKTPEYFSDFELNQINKHLDDLPPQLQRMTIVLEECGMRLSDLCSSTIMIDGRSCLTEVGDGKDSKFNFTYYMPKVKRYNTIPVSPIVYYTLMEAIEESQATFGEFTKYVFAKSIDMPISGNYYCQKMQYMVHTHNIVTDSGEPLNFKAHTFRRTFATSMYNNGLDPHIIISLLGQITLGALIHYASIHKDPMVQQLVPLLEEDNKLIASIGKPLIEVQRAMSVESSQPEELCIALPNGFCSKNIESGVCGEVTQCLECVMFRPTKSDIPVLESQLKKARRNVELAQSQGYQRIADANEDLANRLEAIINKAKET